MRLRLPVPRLVAIAGALAIAAGATAAPVTLTVVHSSQNGALGIILVGPGGKTLYHDSAEPKNVIRCVGACSTQWPPLLVAAGAKPVAGPGLTGSWLGTLKRPDGKMQVTYRGLALYLFAGDTKAGDARGQGSGGKWHAVTPAGGIVTKSVKSSTAPSTSAGQTTSTTPSSGSSSSGSSAGTTTGSGSNSSANAAYCAANPMGCNNGVPITGA